MTFRSYTLWLFGIVIVGGGLLLGYFLAVDKRTSKISTEASFDGATDQSIARSGVVHSYDKETGVLSLLETDTQGIVEIRIDESTLVRIGSAAGQYKDVSRDELAEGQIITITLDAPDDQSAVGAIDILEVR